MERITHLILHLSGLCSLFFCDSKYNYILFQSPKPWSDAQSFCRTNCFDLVTISNTSDLENVLNAVEGKYDDAAWTGLQSASFSEWYWSLSGYDFYDRAPSFTLYWASQPSYDCASYRGGLLYTNPCSSARFSVCFDATKQGPDQYIFTTAAMSWSTAQEYCRTNYTGLVNIRSSGAQLMVDGITNGLEVWIGLFSDNWVWSDQTTPGFRYWPVDHDVWSASLGYCGALMKNESGRWGARACSQQHPFVCKCSSQSVKVRFIQVKVSSDSVLDLNEPAVQNNLLNKISLRLLSDNVTEPFQLQWKKQPNAEVFVKETRQGEQVYYSCRKKTQD